MNELLARRTLLTVRSTISRMNDAAVADTAVAPAPSTARGDVALARAATRYEAIGLLGEGGMGRVEHVRDNDLLRDVAVKHLRPELLGDPNMLAQFLWEARVTAHLDHPNIVPVHDVGLGPDGHLYFTMKLVRGETLADLIARAREQPDAFPLERRLRAFVQICHAVAFAHARGVLHRDLKPANVMIGAFGETLVTDWGIAVPMAGEIGDPLRRVLPPQLVDVAAGTPMYMSPEQLRAEDLDARSDVYTLGTILYELVALAPAIEADDLVAVVTKVTTGDVPPLDTSASERARAIAAVVGKAMARHRDGRYATATALANDVEIVLDGRTPSAESASLVRQAARYYFARDPGMSRLRVVDIDMWMASALALGVALGAFGAHWLGRAAWAALAVASTLGVYPTLRWLRLRRSTSR